VNGDLAYTVGYERRSVSVHGRSSSTASACSSLRRDCPRRLRAAHMVSWVNLEFADELWSDGAAHEPVATERTSMTNTAPTSDAVAW